MKQIVSAMVVLMVFGLMSTGVTYAHVSVSKGTLISNCNDEKKITKHCEELHSSYAKYNQKTCLRRHNITVCRCHGR